LNPIMTGVKETSSASRELDPLEWTLKGDRAELQISQ